MRYWQGVYRIQFGFCPACNSSPPTPHCLVCDGTHRYGTDASTEVRATWLSIWNAQWANKVPALTL